MTSASSWTTPSATGLAIGSVHMPVVPSWPAAGAEGNIQDSSPKNRRPRGTLRAALFELDNVLYDATHWQRWLWQLLSRLSVQRDFARFRRIWQCGYLVEAQRGTREFTDAFHSFLLDWGLSAGQIDEVEAASIAKRRETFQNIRPLPGVAKTLATLSETGIKLAVLANSELPGAELRERLQQLGLAGRFSIVLSSRDLGCVKPAPGSYQSALDALRLAPESVVYVGCLADELTGAADVGLQTAAVNAEAAVTADHCLKRFDDLATVCLPATTTATAS